MLKSYEITPRPVRFPTVTGMVISDPIAAFTFGSETGTTPGLGDAVGVAVFVAVSVGVPLGGPPVTVTLPFVVDAGGSPSFHWKPGWNVWLGSV